VVKAKIVKLHSVRMGGAKLDLDDRVAFIGERASICHIIKHKKRREQLTITRLLDQADRTQTTNRGIVGVFHEFLQSKYEPISVDTECVRQIVGAGHGRLTEVGSDTLDRPLDLKELRILLQKV
jgi:hypothetical protein